MLFYTVSFSCWTCNRHCLAALLYRRKHLVRPRWWTHFGQLPDPALQISRLYSYYYVTFRTSSLSKVLRALTGPWLYLVSLYPIFAGCQIMNNVPGNRSHNDVPDQVSVISLRVSIVKSSVPCLGWGLTRSQSELRFKDFSFLWPRWWTHFGQLSDPALQIMKNEPLPGWHDNW